MDGTVEYIDEIVVTEECLELDFDAWGATEQLEKRPQVNPLGNPVCDVNIQGSGVVSHGRRGHAKWEEGVDVSGDVVVPDVDVNVAHIPRLALRALDPSSGLYRQL
jgi:hypothetical protein